MNWTLACQGLTLLLYGTELPKWAEQASMKILEATLSHGNWMWGRSVPRYGKALFLALDLPHMEPARYLANALRSKCLTYGAMWICLVDVWGCVVETGRGNECFE